MTGDQLDAPNQQVVRADGSAPWDEGTGGGGEPSQPPDQPPPDQPPPDPPPDEGEGEGKPEPKRSAGKSPSKRG
jgi:hypothetical protein